MRYWLFKTEPDVFGFEHLKQKPNRTEHWDGVRNYQARNTLRDDIKRGDKVLFYHSRCSPPHAAGVAVVTREGYPDHTAWDPKSNYFDEKSSEENPRWFMVDVQAERDLERPVSLQEMKENPALSDMKLVQKGNRLSVFEISEAHFDEVLRMAKTPV